MFAAKVDTGFGAASVGGGGLSLAPSGERVHIGFFGVRNAGKSSLVNAVCGQKVALASDVAGTTTDPVRKAMELLPLGPVEIIDTPGIDDVGNLGQQRISRACDVLRSCDVAVLVSVAGRSPLAAERELVGLFEQRGIPYVVARNKADVLDGAASNGGAVGSCVGVGGDCPHASDERSASGVAISKERAVQNDVAPDAGQHAAAHTEILVSARTGQGVDALKERLARIAATAQRPQRLVADLLSPGDVVVLVVPIDSSAPKGRIILPQQMVLRDVLDARAVAVVCQPSQLEATMAGLGDVRLVITDSQVFGQVARIVLESVLLTSFSILMARYKGNLRALVQGAQALASLTDESCVLISEGCTHHRQCEDIGTVKMPAWIRDYCGASPAFEFTQGRDFPSDLDRFDVVVHCGGCMLNAKEMEWRQKVASQSGVPMVNYGVAIACMHGILERALEPLGCLD